MTDHAKVISKALDERFRNRMPDGDTTEWDTYAALDALVAERDRLVAERQRLTDETDKGVRALWDEKNKFMEALEVEMAEKKALIAERERLRDEIDADCVRIVAAEAEVARMRNNALLAGSLINWCIGFAGTSCGDVLPYKLSEARDLLAAEPALAAEETTDES